MKTKKKVKKPAIEVEGLSPSDYINAAETEHSNMELQDWYDWLHELLDETKMRMETVQNDIDRENGED